MNNWGGNPWVRVTEATHRFEEEISVSDIAIAPVVRVVFEFPVLK
jgi:hypothetical protein